MIIIILKYINIGYVYKIKLILYYLKVKFYRLMIIIYVCLCKTRIPSDDL